MKEEQTLKRSSLSLNSGSLKKTLKRPACAFLITAICFFIMLLFSSKYPFGKYTILVSDLEAQYSPYLFMLRQKLLNLNFGRFFSNFGYSFLLGAGKGMAGTFGYYLASPLNLLVIFFDPSKANEFVMVLMGLRISLAAAFMCAFIEERATVKNTNWPILWGVMYAFTSYTMLFLFQIMWLDGYMLLPLLLLLVERYVKAGSKGKLTAVTVVLFLLFLSNYYIAYMAGIYSFFYLLGRMYLLGKFTKRAKPLSIIGRFVARAVFTGLTLCIILLPVGIDTLKNGDPTHSKLEETYVGFTFTKFIDRIFLGYPGEFSDVLMCNMPLIFVCLLVTVLCAVFFVSKIFAGKEKKFYAVCFILIYAVLCINFLDVAWQVFDSPNWFWHRESFVFITLLLTVSYKAFEKIREVSNHEILKAAGVLAILLLAAQSFGEMKGHGELFIANAIIIAVITLLLIGMKKTDWSGQLKDMGKMIPVILAVITIYESAFLAPMLSSGTSTLSVFTTEGDAFVSAMLSFEDCANASNMLGNGFRSEYENIKTVDDIPIGGASQYAGYRGISIFNSNSNKAFDRFLKQLGYSVNYNYFAAGHAYSAPSTDAFFSIGSLYMTNDEYTDADLIASDDNLSFYRRNTVLPLAFTANASARDFDFYALENDVNDKNYFEFQNDWYASLFSSFTEDFFITVDESNVTEEILNGTTINIGDYRADDQFAEEDIQTSEEESEAAFDPDELGLEVASNYYDTQLDVYRINESLPIILNYEVTVDRPDELYVNISVPRTNSGCEVYLNGMLIDTYSDGTFYSSILRLGAFEKGETVQLSILADQDSFTYLAVNFAYFDNEAFEQQFAELDTSKTSITEAEDGYISFTADVAQGDMILTSIPYEDGWEAFVDGQRTEITPYQNALISLDVAPGAHDIQLQYTPPGLKAGAVLSAVGIVGLIALALIDRKNKR